MAHFVKTQAEFQAERKQKQSQSAAVPRVASLPSLVKSVFVLLKNEWKLFLGLAVLYLVTYEFLTQGASHVDLNQVKTTLQQAGQSPSTVSLTTAALGLSNTSTNTNTANESTLAAAVATLLFGLCFIWAVRQTSAGKTIRIRDALYNGPTSIIPVTTVLVGAFFQSLPMAVSIFVFGAASSNGYLNNAPQIIVLSLLLAAGVFISCYWLSVSLLALVAASLPGMYPRQAVKATKDLVGPNRWRVLLYIVIVSLVVAGIWFALVLGAIATGALPLVALLVSVLRTVTVVFAVVFLYKLYRSLLDETA